MENEGLKQPWIPPPHPLPPRLTWTTWGRTRHGKDGEESESSASRPIQYQVPTSPRELPNPNRLISGRVSEVVNSSLKSSLNNGSADSEVSDLLAGEDYRNRCRDAGYNVDAMMAYKTLPGTKNFRKLVHLVVQFLAFFLGVIGVWAALKFHNDKGIDNFYSLHSWLGLTCLVLFGIQWAVGFSTFWYPGGSRNSRAGLLPWHVFFGIYIYALAVATCTTGLLEKVTFLQTNHIISRYSTEALLVNSLGMLIVALGGLVILAVASPVNGHGDILREQ
nr:probable transmembrane ascorbate ferrireductase 2 [Ipomoea batatas]